MPVESPHQLKGFLPAVFHTSPELETLLAAFEPALFRGHPDQFADAAAGSEDDERRRLQQRAHVSIEEQIDRIPELLDPATADDEFLVWLAQWAAISLFGDARDPRAFIAAIIPLYGSRGTGEYVRKVIELYLDASAKVEEEELPGLALGVPSRARVGIESRLGEDPFHFSVRIQFNRTPGDARERSRLLALARAVIDLAKPAYTHYHLSHNLTDGPRGFVIAVRSRVGVDTYLYPTASPAPRERPRP